MSYETSLMSFKSLTLTLAMATLAVEGTVRAVEIEANLGKAGESIFDCVHEVRAALAFAAGAWRMSDSAYRVETTARLAQWRIENLASCAFRKSDPFKMGKWNWHLAVEKNRTLYLKLYPEVSNLTRECPPIASFIIRVLYSVRDRRTLVHPEITDRQLKSSDDFVWAIEVPLAGRFVIDVEFLDLKTPSPTGGDPCSIWTEGFEEKGFNTTALACIGRMLSESIHTDIVINASGGSIGAHRAVLASRSPVFRSMFSDNIRELELSAVNISDMSLAACQALLSYIYGGIRHEEFLAHRLALLRAADKYDISDLKMACHESLLEDINIENVLERLQNASLYQLPKLKASCLRYLLKFGKVFDIREDFDAFLRCADRDLIFEIFEEMLATWKGC
ncbi:hypothetical protein Nepgr_007711 [Nepenthes gracilis]|uniref:BTB domain-containing protein n=1 Tax=Nepenthes gracilis TaxID=150966 RepID=A0AAD3S8C8_NEPGR|nr:hypothetical protein Nepgr_007711 [Nepenthes gracilis]